MGASAIVNAVTKGISGGFTGLGHTVDLWLFGIAGGLLLFLVFGDHFLGMIQSLVQWLHIGTAATGQITHAIHVGSTSNLIPYMPWTPGGYTVGIGGSRGAALAIPWSPAWTVLVGGLWALGMVLGVLALYRGQRIGRPIMMWAPFAVGIAIFALPPALPGLLTAFWGLFTPHLTIAIGSVIGMSAGQSTLIANPFWVWGAMWGISGTHGIAYSKVPMLVSAPLTIAAAGHIAQAFTSVVKLAEGNISLLRETADWLYSVFNVSVLLTVGMTVVLALWTVLLLSAAVWLGISPAWIWIAALDPWSPELLASVIGVALRAFLVQLGAWVWVAGIALMDGGSSHGPFGLPTGFTGLTPWLTLGWTLLGITLAWRFWVIPVWLLLRHVQVDVATWWAQTQERAGNALGVAGARVSQTGHRLASLPLGETPQTWGQRWEDLGDAMQTDSQVLVERARWRGMQSQWSEDEKAAAQQSQIGTSDSAWAHPGGFATGAGLGAQAAGVGGSAPIGSKGSSAQTSATLAAPEHWTIPWRSDGSQWEGQAASSDHAQEIMDHLIKQFKSQGLTAEPPAIPDANDHGLKSQARSQANKEMQQMPYFEHHPDEAESWVKERVKELAEWKVQQLRQNQLPLWRRERAMPDIELDGRQVVVKPQSGTSLAPVVATTLQNPTAMNVASLTRRRLGQTEAYTKGMWVVQPEKAATEGSTPNVVTDPWAGSPQPRMPNEGGPA